MFFFCFFFETARRRLRRASPSSRKCNFLDGDKGRAVRRLVTSKLLPLHRDASKSHPRPRETRENKMAPGSPCKLLFEKCTGFSSDDYQLAALLSDVCSNDGPGYLHCIRVIAPERSSPSRTPRDISLQTLLYKCKFIRPSETFDSQLSLPFLVFCLTVEFIHFFFPLLFEYF